MKAAKPQQPPARGPGAQAALEFKSITEVIDRVGGSLGKLLPEGVTEAEYKMAVINTIAAEPKLLGCNRASLFLAVLCPGRT